MVGVKVGEQAGPNPNKAKPDDWTLTLVCVWFADFGCLLGITYVTYSRASEAALAIEEMNGKPVGDNPRPMKVLFQTAFMFPLSMQMHAEWILAAIDQIFCRKI